MQLTQEELLKILKSVEQSLKFGHAIAQLTPTDIDNQAIALLQKVLVVLMPYAEDGTLVTIINFILSFVGPKGSVLDLLEKLKKA